MMRRAWAVAAAGVVAGWAGAQTPTMSPKPPAAKAGPETAAGVMTLKTAGQPDRKVRVVKSTKAADGRVVTEVKDVATGETLLVSDKSIGGKTDAVVTTTPMVPPVKSSNLAADMKAPPTALVPKAKPRTADPLLNGGTKGPAAMTAAATPKAPAPKAPAPATASTMAKAPAPKPLPATMPSAIAAKPAAPTPATVPTGTVPMAGDAIHVVLPVNYVPAEFRMKEETAGAVATLQQSARPTLRQDAATALAEGRFGARPEIKSILAGAAMHDPAAVVRAHCVTCLSRLGYAEPSYVAFLRQGTVDADPAVKAATAEALAKLEPRK
jgi:hypothetical protein